MSSSCSNPFLYGWLNQNFRNEFKEIFILFKRFFLRVCLQKEPTLVRIVREPENSLTLSPNNKIIHYEPKNSQCTITDYTNVTEKKSNMPNMANSVTVNNISSKNVVISIEEKRRCSVNDVGDNDNGTFGANVNVRLLDSKQHEMILADGTGQTVVNHQSINRNNINTNTSNNCRFKRLSLTDSRKRRKRNQLALTGNVDQNFNILTDNNSAECRKLVPVISERNDIVNGHGPQQQHCANNASDDKCWNNLAKSVNEESCHDVSAILLPFNRLIKH